MDVRSELVRRRGRGPGILLREILATQSGLEYYTEEHFLRLIRYEAVHLDRPPRMERCAELHGPNCRLGCRSCHSCRQKTVGRKTECSCGRGTGFWCGSCLNTRMGQNIDEVFRMPDWRCPSCLEICNCSGRTCDRHNAGLGCTRILSAEAREQGYKSTAHYLIQTHLEVKLGIAPSVTAAPFHVNVRHKRGFDGPANADHKRPRFGRPAPRGLKELVEVELPRPKLAPEVSAAEEAAFRMTAMWSELPSVSPVGAAGVRPGQGHAAAAVQDQRNLRQANGHSGLASGQQQHQQNAADPWQGFTRSRQPQQQHKGFGQYLQEVPAAGRRAGPGLASLFGFRQHPGQWQGAIPHAAGTQHHQETAGPVPADNDFSPADLPADESDHRFDGPHPGLWQDGHEGAQPSGRRATGASRLQRATGQQDPAPPGAWAGRQLSHASAGPRGQAHYGSGAHSQQHRAQNATVRQGFDAPENSPPAGAHMQQQQQQQQQQQDGHPYGGTSEQPQPAGGSLHENWAHQEPMDATAEARQQHARCTPRSQGLFASALRFAQGYYKLGYTAGSEEREAVVEGIEMLLNEVQAHLLAPVCVSAYNKDLQASLKSDEDRPDHDMRDHDALRDACSFLLIAADALEGQHDAVARLVFNDDPFVDFSGSDPQAKAILVKTAFELYDLMLSRGGSRSLLNAAVDKILGFVECLVTEHEQLLDYADAASVDIGPLKAGPFQLHDQLRQLQSDVATVREGNDLVLQRALMYVQKACSSCGAGTEVFLQPRLLCLIGRRRVSEDVRFLTCCLLTMFLASVGPDQAGRMDLEELWDRQHALARALSAAKVAQLLEALIAKTAPEHQQSPLFQWNTATAVAADAPDAVHTCQKVDAIKDKLLARLMGLFVAAGMSQWKEMVRLAITPSADLADCAQAGTRQRRSACVFLAVGLQATPGSLGAREAQDLLRLWMREAFDTAPAGCSIFAYLTEALQSSPPLRACFEGLDIKAAVSGLKLDASGAARASLLQHVVLQSGANPAQQAELLHDLPDHVDRMAKHVAVEGRHSWEAAAAKLLLAACEAVGPRGLDFVVKTLKLLPAWMKRAVGWRHLCHEAFVKGQCEMLGSYEEKAPADDSLSAERAIVRETCVGSLGAAFKLLAQIYRGSTPSGPRSFTPMIPLLRGLLAPATELASGAYLPAADLTQPGSGRALDVMLAEEAAAALAAAGSGAFLHYVLGTSLHLLLNRSERCAVNVLRLLTELFRQPTLRQSEAQVRLLLPPLLGPLQEALSPTVGPARASLRVQEAAVAYFRSLVVTSGAQVVPQLQNLPIPSCNRAEDFTLFHRGGAPDALRYWPAMQRMLQLTCCHALNALSPSLKGAADAAGPANRSLTAAGIQPAIQRLSKPDVKAIKDGLTHLLGTSRPLEATKAVYADLLPAKCEPAVPPDFYCRLSERSLQFLASLAAAGAPGADWAMAAAAAARPVLAAAGISTDLRKLYDALLQVLEACGQEVSALRIRQQPPPAPPAAPPPATARAQQPPQLGPLQQQNQAAPARSRAPEGERENEGPDKRRRVVQDTPAAQLAVGTVLHRVEGTYAQFAAFKEHHHRLELQAATFQREEASPVLPLTPRTHVLIENSCLQGEAGTLLVDQRLKREMRKEQERIVMLQVRFHRMGAGGTMTALIFAAGTTRDGSKMLIRTLPRALQPSAAMPVASTQPLGGAFAASQASTVPAGTPVARRSACPVPWSPPAVSTQGEPSQRQAQPESSGQQQPRGSSSAQADMSSLLVELMEMQLSKNVETNKWAIQQALDEKLHSREEVLLRAVGLLMPTLQ